VQFIKTIRNGSSARDYILTGRYATQDQFHAAYVNIPGVIENYVENIFSDVQKIQKSGKKMMEMNVIPYHDYPKKCCLWSVIIIARNPSSSVWKI
jgi:N-acetylneuraminic acid mutarotase